MQELIAHQETINRQLARYGVKFGIYKNGEFKERLFPFDPLPRHWRMLMITPLYCAKHFPAIRWLMCRWL